MTQSGHWGIPRVNVRLIFPISRSANKVGIPKGNGLHVFRHLCEIYAAKQSDDMCLNRAIILAALAIFAFAGVAVAQQPKTYRIGFLSPASAASMEARVGHFRQGLRELGYVEGQNTTIEYRWADGKEERLSDLALELVRLKVDVLASHGVLATQAAKRASSTIPIVCFACGDAVSVGLVASLARPGGNITGLTVLAPEVSGKRVELLKEVVPGLSRLAVLWNSDNPVSKPEFKEAEAAAQSGGLQLQSVSVTNPKDFARAFNLMKTDGAQALIVLSDAMLFGNRKQIADHAAAIQLPAISYTGEFAKSGALMGYGPDLQALATRAAFYVDKILKGAKPGDLPIEQPAKFELVINLKTAKALGLTVPHSVLQRADELIE
jgi:putative ABC transport system substrate-binding protein